MKFEKKDLFTIPNILTYVRFICVPFFVWMMAEYYLKSQLVYAMAGLGIFVFASITDVVDGYIARHFNMISDLGKMMDPVADKVLQCMAMVMIGIQPYMGWTFWIFAAFMILKEVLMGVFSNWLMAKSKKQVEQKSNKWGKAGAAINFSAIAIAFFIPIAIYFDEKSGADIATKVLLYIDYAVLVAGALLSLYNLVQYNLKYYRQYVALRDSGALDALDAEGNPIVAEGGHDGVAQSEDKTESGAGK